VSLSKSGGKPPHSKARLRTPLTAYHPPPMRDLRIRVHYPYPPARVWRAIATREALGSWLMENDFAPVVGTAFRFRADAKGAWDGVIACEVLAVDEPRRLSYSWSGAWGDSTVTWTLTPSGDGTDLLLEHTGFRGFSGLVLGLILGSGWKRKLNISVHALLDR
jgi:uncharacterized protein YndB with AHSA1/START domain